MANHEPALIEKFIQGPELTVGLLEEKPLAPIRIVPKRGFFDFEAKYKAADTEHRFDTGLPAGRGRTMPRAGPQGQRGRRRPRSGPHRHHA